MVGFECGVASGVRHANGCKHIAISPGQAVGRPEMSSCRLSCLASHNQASAPICVQGGLTYLQKARKCPGITIAERFQACCALLWLLFLLLRAGCLN